MPGLLPPCDGIIQSPFGPRNLANDYAYWYRANEDAAFYQYAGATLGKFHAGTDKAPPDGTALVASEAGLVTLASLAPEPGTYGGGGIVVEVAITGGMRYALCHCSRALVSVGQQVTRGQAIAIVGDTGNTSQVHVHQALVTGSGTATRFHNPEDYWVGGKYASSPLILPALPPLVAVNNPPAGSWINIRSAPSLSATVLMRSIDRGNGNGIYTVPGDVLQYKLASGFLFIAWKVDAAGNVWAQIKTGSGQVYYVASWLIHVIRGTLPPKP